LSYVITLAFLHNAYIIFLSWLAVLFASINCQALVSASPQITNCRTRGLEFLSVIVLCVGRVVQSV